MSSTYNTVAASAGSGVQLTNVILDVWSKEIIFKAQPQLRFESICVRQNELGALPGTKIKFLKYNPVTGSYNLTEGTPMETGTISTATIEISVGEKGKALQFSELLLRSSQVNVLENASTLLGMHYAKTRDAEIRDVLMAGTNIIYANQKANRAALTSSDVFNMDLIRDSVETLATAKAPKFGDAYICFIHPHQGRSLRGDAGWISVQNYANPQNILNGEIGRIEDVRFIETTQIPYIKKGTQDIWADAEDTGSNTIVAANAATDVYRAVVVGDYACGLAEALPVEMRDNGVQDFGRQHSIGYYGIWGMGLIEEAHSLILETA